MVGIGGLCRDIGYPLGAGVLSTLLMWAGPAQVILFGSIASGAALPAVAIAVSLSSIRFLPMTMSILPMMRRPNMPVWQLLLLAHLVAVTGWLQAVRVFPELAQQQRMPYFIGFTLTLLMSAAAATAAGYFLIGELPPAFAAGLLFTTPIFFTLSLLAGARQLLDWLALGLGFVIAPVAFHVVPAGLDLMVEGLVAGSLAYLIHRLVRARRRDA